MMVVILTGPTASGKSTVGRALAQALGWMLVDVDDLTATHGTTRGAARPQSGAHERRDDGVRELTALINRAIDRRESLIVACPAIREHDRETLRGNGRQVRFVYLKTPRAVLESRLEDRPNRSLVPRELHAELMAVEDPGESALVLDGSKAPDILVPTICREFGL
jgi:gluconokinase